MAWLAEPHQSTPSSGTAVHPSGIPKRKFFPHKYQPTAAGVDYEDEYR